MARTEIPLLRESEPFVTRLMTAAGDVRQPRYFLHRRINWSYRYDEAFYDREVAYFLRDPDVYMAGGCTEQSKLSDVHRKKLGARQVGVVLMKVLSHRLFDFLGKISIRPIQAARTRIYRKGYVDDIELVFEQNQEGVVRAIFPFPVNLRRQLRYLSDLRRKGRLFRLSGNPYAFGDILRFIARRDVRSLMRMESRAQIRQALAVRRLGVCEVQLSDEFDIGSLDFVRYLARYPISVVNSAHGVGKYYPVHCYREFHVLTNRQKRYYHAIRGCKYVLRQLNDNSVRQSPQCNTTVSRMEERVRLVVLSQRFGGPHDIIADAERELLDYLRRGLDGVSGVKLFYKPHPNRSSFDGVLGFASLSSLSQVNDLDGTIYVSFFSTCQIDPAFKGRKVLIRAKHIYPEVAFDDSEPILTMEELVALVREQASASRG
ncbi:MAG: hypothetical protein AB7P31_03340 [Steroidobacteraceae bacterium]